MAGGFFSSQGLTNQVMNSSNCSSTYKSCYFGTLYFGKKIKSILNKRLPFKKNIKNCIRTLKMTLDISLGTYILKVNTLRGVVEAVRTAKVFKSGNSLAVRLPKDFRVKEKELCIMKVGNKILLFPPEQKWDVAFDELAGVQDLCRDFLKERRQPSAQERELF